jgi:hypothetical protein
MITRETLPDAPVLAYKLSGKVTDADYRNVLIPDIEERAESGHVRLALLIGSDLEGFSLSTLLTDARMGVDYRDEFERIAIATDNSLVRTGVHLMSPFLPFEVKFFAADEQKPAVEWAGSSAPQPIHRLNRRKGILIIKPKGELDRGQFDLIARDVDAHLKDHQKLNGVLLDGTHFQGWQNFAAMTTHLKFIKSHHRSVKKIALVSDYQLLNVIPRIAEHFIRAEVKVFKPSRRNQALRWIEGLPATTRATASTVQHSHNTGGSMH